MRFDWYAATVSARPDAVLAVFRDQYIGAEFRDCKPLNGYESAVEILGPHGTMAKILHGGRNGDPHMFASGDDTDRFVPIVREFWPDHRVTRMDAAEDFDAEHAFERLMAECIAVADDVGLQVEHAGDWHREELGRTLYLGSRKSPVRLRLYEKGKQLRAQILPEHGQSLISPNWTRLELQVRPQKESRYTAAISSPEQAFGFSAWARALAERALALDVPRVQVNVWREADDERAFAFMCRQYGPMLRRLQGQLGDWCCVGMTIGDALSRLDRDGCL